MLATGIIEKCRSNDRKAQLQLYHAYCDGMYVVAQRFVKDSMEAEDIVQESFIKAFMKLHQFKGEVTFGAWLKRIVINKCIDTLKARKQQLIELQDVHLKVVDAAVEDEWFVEDAITADEVKAAINDLPDKYKYVLMLYLIEGYDHAEIAQILKITQVASRTQLSRGREKLKQLLIRSKDGTRP
ncbi:MAG: sigma-70 family RNA polymerase sigma factor [Flavobacteriaceae bacterium]|nr:sigma-70 family RNA polymerase sigma factor [Flavobacteriaceae bacterium]